MTTVRGTKYSGSIPVISKNAYQLVIPPHATSVVYNNTVKKVERIQLYRFLTGIGLLYDVVYKGHTFSLDEYYISMRINQWVDTKHGQWAMQHSLIPIEYHCTNGECILSTKVFADMATFHRLKWG